MSVKSVKKYLLRACIQPFKVTTPRPEKTDDRAFQIDRPSTRSHVDAVHDVEGIACYRSATSAWPDIRHPTAKVSEHGDGVLGVQTLEALDLDCSFIHYVGHS
jgi:hypothetical protein